MKILVSTGETMTLNTYLDEESSPWWSYVIGLPGMIIGGVKSLFVQEEHESKLLGKSNRGAIELSKKSCRRLEC